MTLLINAGQHSSIADIECRGRGGHVRTVKVKRAVAR